MSSEPLLNGEGILDVIPQRPPVVMVDVLYAVSDDSADTGLTIDPECIFCRDGRLSEPGILEHSAQSAALFAGYGNYLKGEAPHLGYIAELKNFAILTLPQAGMSLRTHLSLAAVAMGMSLMKVDVKCNGELVASGQMKIYVKEDNEGA